MARPQAANYDERKEKILRTAAKVFADEGYHKASVNTIAAQCDMSKSLIYHYFSSKQDILYHSMIDHVKELDKLAQEVLADTLPAEKKLKRIIRRYLKIYQDTVAEHHLLINELSNLSAGQKEEVVSIQNSVVQVFADLAHDLSPAPLEAHKGKTVVSMLMLGMMNWTYIWFKPGGPMTSDDLADMIANIFLNGLKGLK
ncbi:TetR/AcrR family transcriptional regulator [Temperatibacter marinus]|uniref:TetR/AcrR family transcriptional regulator n=1 Tax=Temperatibacter marinus TaxID=1456591 RepID=A0AA52EG66_9PROT|nr:TetR/AcrR family transcriptional regulator [Temperatibacter marinus]WND01481.1 TetR/AcrR family transcriptional regulator [Temperatibacter marinus]